MKPEDVPAGVLDAVRNAPAPANHVSADAETWARIILAAALPAHEAMVRAEIIEDIEAAYGLDTRGEDDGHAWGIFAAIRTVRQKGEPYQPPSLLPRSPSAGCNDLRENLAEAAVERVRKICEKPVIVTKGDGRADGGVWWSVVDVRDVLAALDQPAKET